MEETNKKMASGEESNQQAEQPATKEMAARMAFKKKMQDKGALKAFEPGKLEWR